jgi:hypothetical protein
MYYVNLCITINLNLFVMQHRVCITVAVIETICDVRDATLMQQRLYCWNIRSLCEHAQCAELSILGSLIVLLLFPS